jgi:GxxExxY protein
MWGACDGTALRGGALQDSWGLLRGLQGKGPGFLEDVYQECLEIEFQLRDIPARPKAKLRLDYKGRILVQTYEPDFIVFDKVILEIKALSGLHDKHRAQVHNYLKATGQRVGLLVNSGAHPQLEHDRIIR